MTKQDLRIGMVLELETVTGEITLATIVETKVSSKCISGESVWFDVNELTDNLVNKYSGRKVTKVYDIPEHNCGAHEVSTTHRTLLWERKEVKELPVAEIEKLLGFPVKIVKE